MEAGLGRWLNPWYQRTREWWITFDFFFLLFSMPYAVHISLLSLILFYFIKTLSGGKCMYKFSLCHAMKKEERKCCFMLWHWTVQRKSVCVCEREKEKWERVNEGGKGKFNFGIRKFLLLWLCYAVLYVCVCWRNLRILELFHFMINLSFAKRKRKISSLIKICFTFFITAIMRHPHTQQQQQLY